MRMLIVLACAGLVAACGSYSYYKVRDAATGREYYTTDIDRSGSAVRFKDGRTGSSVTLQNSEVTNPSDVYNQAVK